VANTGGTGTSSEIERSGVSIEEHIGPGAEAGTDRSGAPAAEEEEVPLLLKNRRYHPVYEIGHLGYGILDCRAEAIAALRAISPGISGLQHRPAEILGKDGDEVALSIVGQALQGMGSPVLALRVAGADAEGGPVVNHLDEEVPCRMQKKILTQPLRCRLNSNLYQALPSHRPLIPTFWGRLSSEANGLMPLT
jgi:hypothetical protein